MGKHIIRNEFVENYTRWICHGEAHRAREEVIRQRIDDYDVDAGCADMLADFHEAHFEDGPREELPEPTAKQYYDMLSAAQKPLHQSHWFDPNEVRRTPHLGLVEIRQSSVYPGDDVYIVAQQATQVYYLSYPCKTDDRLLPGTRRSLLSRR